MGSKMLLFLLVFIAFATIGDCLQHQVKNMGSIGGVNDHDSLDVEQVKVPDNVQRVLDIIYSVGSMPSCAKIATSSLMHSCSSIEGSFLNEDAELNRGSDLFLADEMGLYAARLAVCELSEADSSIPKDCEVFVPSKGTEKQSGFRAFWTGTGPSKSNPVYGPYDDVTQTQSKQCINALYAVPQAWTSFSNSKQNAVTICRAMRSKIENDEHVQIAKILAETAVAASDNLQDAYEQINIIKARFEELRTSIPKFHQDVAIANAMQREQVAQFWSELQMRFNDDVYHMTEGVRDIRINVNAANDDVDNLQSNIRAATDNVHVGLHGMASKVTGMSDTLVNFHQVMGYETEHGSQLIAQFVWEIAHNMSLANEKLQEAQGETGLLADQTREKMLELNSTMNSFPVGFAVEWAGAVQGVMTSAKYVVVYTLLGFGVWERYAGFSTIGSIFASLGSAIVLACISITMPMDLTSLLDYIPDSAKDSAVSHWFFFGFVVFTIGCCAFVTVKSIIGQFSGRSDPQVKEYDPASPWYPSGEKWLI